MEFFDFEACADGQGREELAYGPEHINHDLSSIHSADFELEDDVELTLEEAALHAYRSHNPLRPDLLPITPPDYDGDLADPPRVAEMQKMVDLAGILGPEKWDVDQEALQLLAPTRTLMKEYKSDLRRQGLHPGFRDLRLDEPVLKTDPHLEMLRILERNEVHLTSDGFDRISLNVEKDESIKWPKHILQLPSIVDKQIASEKLEVDMETVEYLRDIFQGPKADLSELAADEREKKARFKLLSSPLLPLSPPRSPQWLDHSIADVELTSTPPDPTTEDAAQIEHRILEQDEEAMQQRAADVMRTQRKSLDLDSSSGVHSSEPASFVGEKTTRLSDLKISDPLLPQESSDSSVKGAKRVTFQEEVQEFVPQTDSSMDSAEVHAAVNEVMASIAPLAEQAIGRSKAEELSEADTVLRVPVPQVDSLKPVMPWDVKSAQSDNSQSLDRQRWLLQELASNLSKEERKWDISKASEKAMNWVSFPTQHARVKPEDEFDDGSLTRYLQELDLDGDFDMKLMTWKPDGIRVLDEEDEDDEEIKPLDIPDEPPPPANGLREMLERRKKQIEESKKRSAQQMSSHGALGPPTKVPRQAEKDDRASDLDLAMMRPEQTGLASFAALQGWSAPPKGGPVQQPGPQEAADRPIPQQPANKAAQILEPPSSTATPAVPTPIINPPPYDLPIIVSSTLMTDHKLLRHLERLLPTLQIVERIYTDPTTRKADIILSPGVGLHFTTLQKLKQRPLPGQPPSKTTIHSLLPSLCHRYTTLHLLITPPHPTYILDASDTSALNALTTHPTLPNLRPLYLPSPNPSIQAAYTAALVVSSHHQPPSPHQPLPLLLSEETYWELFLRKAGLNAFAAQVVISQLKTEGGLAAFVTMAPQERVRRFGELMGGEEVLERVSRVLEKGWMSAANF